MYCPSCGKEITTLDFIEHGATVRSSFFLGGLKKKSFFYSSDEVESSDSSEYCCPECGAKIADDQDKAIRFLSGA